MISLLLPLAFTIACEPGKTASEEATPELAGSTEDSGGDEPDAETGDGSTDSEVGTTGETGEVEDSDDPNELLFDALITITEPMTGDLSCYRPGTDCWEMRAYEDCVNSREVVGVVLDGATNAAIPQASVDVFWDDAIGDAPDTTLVADSEGRVSDKTLPTCVPLTWRISGDPELTVPALYAHQVFPPSDGEIDAVFQAVSTETMTALATNLGLELDPALGMVTGRIVDCVNAPLAMTQVIARDAEGNYPASQTTHYFVGDTPDAHQPHTSEDGRWLIAGLPPGSYQVDVWGFFETLDEHMWMSFSQLDVVAGGISSVELRIEIAGPIFPDDCLVSCD